MLTSQMTTRLISGGLAIGLAAVFGLAALLEPSPVGHGTHTQLGLGGCTFLEITGQPCPMCGATTSWSLLAHFDPIGALINQPFAVLLFFIAAGTFAVAVAEVLDPRGRWGEIARWVEPREGVLAGGFLVLMGLGWAYKMTLM